MPIALYMDHHVPRAITLGLRLRKADVITAYEDGTNQLDDAGVLDRASELGRVLLTRDNDLLAEATRRQREGIPFSGIVYAHQLRVSIGRWCGGFGAHRQGWRTRRYDKSSDVFTALKADRPQNYSDLDWRVAYYVDRILKGAKPAVLLVE